MDLYPISNSYVRAVSASADARGLDSNPLLLVTTLGSQPGQAAFWYDSALQRWLVRDDVRAATPLRSYDAENAVTYSSVTPRVGPDMADAWPLFAAPDGRVGSTLFIESADVRPRPARATARAGSVPSMTAGGEDPGQRDQRCGSRAPFQIAKIAG